MEQYIKDIIKAAFDRCWGLQDGLIKGGELLDLYTYSLANQSGIRIDYINEHLEEIKGL